MSVSQQAAQPFPWATVTATGPPYSGPWHSDKVERFVRRAKRHDYDTNSLETSAIGTKPSSIHVLASSEKMLLPHGRMLGTRA